MVIDLGVVEHIEARSAGRPGQRTFHLHALDEAGQSASLKLEKEHLIGLLVGIRDILTKLRYQGGQEAPAPRYSPTEADHEYAVGQLGLGHSAEEGMIILEARELQVESSEDSAAIRLRFRPTQGASLVTQLEKIITSGRPVCPLCGAPVDPAGHMCIKSNGHSRDPFPDDGESEG